MILNMCAFALPRKHILKLNEKEIPTSLTKFFKKSMIFNQMKFIYALLKSEYI